jgi:hypothetical protein
LWADKCWRAAAEKLAHSVELGGILGLNGDGVLDLRLSWLLKYRIFATIEIDAIL